MTALIQHHCQEMGPITFHELAVLIVFTILVILWFFREPEFMTGWADVLPQENEIGEEVLIKVRSFEIIVFNEYMLILGEYQ